MSTNDLTINRYRPKPYLHPQEETSTTLWFVPKESHKGISNARVYSLEEAIADRSLVTPVSIAFCAALALVGGGLGSLLLFAAGVTGSLLWGAGIMLLVFAGCILSGGHKRSFFFWEGKPDRKRATPYLLTGNKERCSRIYLYSETKSFSTAQDICGVDEDWDSIVSDYLVALYKDDPNSALMIRLADYFDQGRKYLQAKALASRIQSSASEDDLTFAEATLAQVQDDLKRDFQEAAQNARYLSEEHRREEVREALA